MIYSLLLFLSLLSINASASEYYPHTPVDPQTLAAGSVALQTTPGGSISSHFFLSSLSLGLFKRIEIGTIPSLNFLQKHKYNYISWAVNLSPKQRPLQFGFTYNRSISYANNSAFLRTYKASDEWSLDGIYKISSKVIFSSGIGRHQTEILPTEENSSFGLGASVTFLRPKKTLATPRFGLHYLTGKKRIVYLLTSSFK